MPANRHWTTDEIQRLQYWWGEESRQDTADRFGRTKNACTTKMRKLTGSGAARSRDSSLSFITVVEKTGYSRNSIRKALKSLRLSPSRAGSTYRISAREYDLIKAWLREHFTKWARLWARCQNCGSTDKVGPGRHQAKGLCFGCYGREWVRTNRAISGRGESI